MRTSGARTRVILWVLIFVACLTSILPPSDASALISSSALTLQTGAGGDGGSKPGGVVKNAFTFTTTNITVGAIEFQYCVEAEPLTSCTNATLATGSGGLGMSTSGATASGLSSGISAFTLNNSTNGDPYLTHSAVAIGAAAQTVTLNGITNPTAANKSFYVRIKFYSTTTPTGSPIDATVVAASTASPIVLTGQMPESLTFCTGAIIPNVGGAGTAPDCPNATAGTIQFSTLFSTTATATATSQMAASTNAGGGYAITYTADTLKNGTYSIRAVQNGLGTTDTSHIGQGQFGLNLAVNTTPAVGTALYNPGIVGNTYNGAVDSTYNTANNFAFFTNTPTTVAASAGTVTDLETYTVSYMVNVPGSQPAGTYTTTITYICTPTF